MPELQTLMSGIVFGESPRWHKERLWFSDWGAQVVIAVDLQGKSEVIVRVASFPFCIDWTGLMSPIGHGEDFSVGVARKTTQTPALGEVERKQVTRLCIRVTHWVTWP